MAITREQAIKGTKVKVPTQKSSGIADLDEFLEEQADIAEEQGYFVIDRLLNNDENIVRITANGAIYQFLLEDLELYEEEPSASTLPIESAINPSHYQVNGEQVWDQMLRLFGVEKMKAFCEVNAYKYFSRAGKKAGNPLEQDMEKCIWYLKKLRELENDK